MTLLLLQSAKTVDVPPEARFGDDASAFHEGEQISGVVVHAEPTFGFILTHKGKVFFSPSSCPTAGKGSTVTCMVQQGQKGARAHRVSVVAGAVAPPKSSVPDALVVQCRCSLSDVLFLLVFVLDDHAAAGAAVLLRIYRRVKRSSGLQALSCSLLLMT
jgi:cold shock CspA family protein